MVGVAFAAGEEETGAAEEALAAVVAETGAAEEGLAAATGASLLEVVAASRPAAEGVTEAVVGVGVVAAAVVEEAEEASGEATK